MKKYFYVFEHSLFDFYDVILKKDQTSNFQCFTVKNEDQYTYYIEHPDFTSQYQWWDTCINKWLEAFQKTDCEAICAILGPHFYNWANNGFLDYARQKCKNIVLILNLDDSTTAEYLPNCLALMDIRQYFDAVISFNPEDAKKYNLFQHDILYGDISYINEKELPIIADVSLVCAAYDRLDKIYTIYNYLTKHGLTCNFHLAGVPQELRWDLPGIHYHNQYISYEEALTIEAQSRCILEILKKDREGNTPRVYEAIGLNKLLLSNNTHMQSTNNFYTDNIQFYTDVTSIDTAWIKQHIPNYPQHIKKLLTPQTYINFIEEEILKPLDQTLLSLGICVYNAEKTLPLLFRTIPNLDGLEIIIVNDGSKDNSLKLIQNFAETRQNVKIINFKQNQGLGAARQAAYEAMTGRYITYADADDLLLPDFIRLFNRLKHNFYANCDIIAAAYMDFRPFFGFNPIAPWGHIVTAKFWNKYNLRWNTNNQVYEDILLVPKILQAKPHICLDGTLWHYLYNFPNKQSICGRTTINKNEVFFDHNKLDNLNAQHCQNLIKGMLNYVKEKAGIIEGDARTTHSFNRKLAHYLTNHSNKTNMELLQDSYNLFITNDYNGFSIY